MQPPTWVSLALPARTAMVQALSGGRCRSSQGSRQREQVENWTAYQPEPASPRLPGWLWSQCDPGGG